MLADYGDVVPRREYERIEALNITNTESLERYKTDYDGLIKEHQVLLEQHKIMSSERDEFSHELGLMKRSATPRYCSGYTWLYLAIPGHCGYTWLLWLYLAIPSYSGYTWL